MALFVEKVVSISRQVFKRPAILRNISTTRCAFENYEGDGKTTVTILNREHKHLIMFDSVSNYGFRLNTGIFVIGPMAAFPRTIMQWNVHCPEEITIESFSLFTLLEPKLDIFILGTGDKQKLIKPEIVEYLKSKKIAVEILPTENACATFNFLNVEGRCLAGAFFPPENVTVYEDDFERLKLPPSEEMGYIT